MLKWPLESKKLKRCMSLNLLKKVLRLKKRNKWRKKLLQPLHSQQLIKLVLKLFRNLFKKMKRKNLHKSINSLSKLRRKKIVRQQQLQTKTKFNNKLLITRAKRFKVMKLHKNLKQYQTKIQILLNRMLNLKCSLALQTQLIKPIVKKTSLLKQVLM